MPNFKHIRLRLISKMFIQCGHILVKFDIDKRAGKVPAVGTPSWWWRLGFSIM